MVKKNEPLSYDKESLPVKVVGKHGFRDDSTKLREATELIANRNFDTNSLLKLLKDGTLTEWQVNNLVKFRPKRYKHPARAAIAKFKVDKKRNKEKEAVEKKRKKEQAPLRNVRKGGEFPKKHGGKITYKMTGGQVVDAGYE
jgi:hypothetical protein